MSVNGWTWDAESQRWTVRRGTITVTAKYPEDLAPEISASVFAAALAGQELPRITFVQDSVNDGVAVEVDGEQKWWENSFASIGQFFLHSPELLGRPVILEWRVAE